MFKIPRDAKRVQDYWYIHHIIKKKTYTRILSSARLILLAFWEFDRKGHHEGRPNPFSEMFLRGISGLSSLWIWVCWSYQRQKLSQDQERYFCGSQRQRQTIAVTLYICNKSWQKINYWKILNKHLTIMNIIDMKWSVTFCTITPIRQVRMASTNRYV